MYRKIRFAFCNTKNSILLNIYLSMDFDDTKRDLLPKTFKLRHGIPGKAKTITLYLSFINTFVLHLSNRQIRNFNAFKCVFFGELCSFI